MPANDPFAYADGTEGSPIIDNSIKDLLSVFGIGGDSNVTADPFAAGGAGILPQVQIGAGAPQAQTGIQASQPVQQATPDFDEAISAQIGISNPSISGTPPVKPTAPPVPQQTATSPISTPFETLPPDTDGVAPESPSGFSSAPSIPESISQFGDNLSQLPGVETLGDIGQLMLGGNTFGSVGDSIADGGNSLLEMIQAALKPVGTPARPYDVTGPAPTAPEFNPAGVSPPIADQASVAQPDPLAGFEDLNASTDNPTTDAIPSASEDVQVIQMLLRLQSEGNIEAMQKMFSVMPPEQAEAMQRQLAIQP